MLREQFEEISKKGLKPCIYIDTETFKDLTVFPALKSLVSEASKIGYLVFRTNDKDKMNKIHKLHVSRYGCIDPVTEAMVKRKKGIIVSGNF